MIVASSLFVLLNLLLLNLIFARWVGPHELAPRKATFASKPSI